MILEGLEYQKVQLRNKAWPIISGVPFFLDHLVVVMLKNGRIFSITDGESVIINADKLYQINKINK